ncbi:TetR/AcrR family transcriptional regulator, partial [Priestia sp. SIMBA_032]
VRERIIDAAIDVFAISGFRASTMKDIADRAGISQRGLAHHFASKFDLLSAVLSVREQESASLLAPSPSGHPVDALESMLEVIADNNKRPGLVELYSILAAEGTTEDHPA